MACFSPSALILAEASCSCLHHIRCSSGFGQYQCTTSNTSTTYGHITRRHNTKYNNHYYSDKQVEPLHKDSEKELMTQMIYPTVVI